ncbi:MAG: hypothetical protein R3B13_16840 [Polyangiaceae bacterium]
MRKLDPDEVYERALARPDAVGDLDDVELLVYAVKELETYSDMQGWDAFFTGSCSYLYPDVRRCLTAAADLTSLAVLDDYVAYHAERSVPFEPDAIDELSLRETDAERRSRPDWRGRFQRAQPERWARIGAYLKSLGVELVESPPDEAMPTELADVIALVKGKSG